MAVTPRSALLHNKHVSLLSEATGAAGRRQVGRFAPLLSLSLSPCGEDQIWQKDSALLYLNEYLSKKKKKVLI